MACSAMYRTVWLVSSFIIHAPASDTARWLTAETYVFKQGITIPPVAAVASSIVNSALSLAIVYVVGIIQILAFNDRAVGFTLETILALVICRNWAFVAPNAVMFTDAITGCSSACDGVIVSEYLS